jgi:methylphosphotriester-DNA--protein-cysteine methyltransferase
LIPHKAFNGFGGRRLLYDSIANGSILFAGNSALKIYGTLNCGSGKRMKPVNRVFFSSEAEAISAGYRPCGSCLKKQYTAWKQKT